jgi:Protein kinase domain.
VVQVDNRTPLAEGLNIALGDVTYTIEKLIGFGANAFVYLASYKDNINRDKKHTVLIKEMFPYHPKGLIYRTQNGSIYFAGEVRDYFNLQKKSFLHGNAFHLDIQNIRGDKASVNINSFEKNGTLYTILGNSNGETLLAAARGSTITSSLSNIVSCMLGILDALEVFHKNGLLHLDISPDNILLMPPDKNDEQYRRMMLIDYNSTLSTGELAENTNLYFSIKEHYSAPEVRLQDKKSISFASDLFSVCAIFLEYLQGKPLDFYILYSSGKILDCNTELLANIPATAAAKAVSIIKKGLRLPPKMRYQSIEDLRADFIELRNRINCVGITHSSLWESSKVNFQNSIYKNKQYRYLFKDSDLLPCNVKLNDNESCPFDEAIKHLSISKSPHVQIKATGGMGKTTALIQLWKRGISSYNPRSPVPVYIPLYNYKESSIPYIKGCLLERLKYDDKTTTIEDTLRLLNCLLDSAGKDKCSILLLLDGLNEVNGNNRLLLLEIDDLMKKNGVQIILATRMENTQLKLNTLEILPLTEYEIKHYLTIHNILYPGDKSLQHIIINHMMLSIYTATCITGHKFVDAHSMDELLGQYINSLLSTHKEHTIGNQTEQLQAEYAIRFLLPSIVHRMKQLKSHALTANEVYKAVQKSFHMLTGKSFLRCYPQYIGRSKLIRSQAKTPEEWFNDAVNIMLIDKFALLYCDGYGNYILSHQNFYDYFLREHTMESTKLRAAKVRLSLPYAAALCLIIAALTFSIVKITGQIAVSYPKTVQEKGIVENAMTAVADNLSRLGMQIKNDTAVLDSYSGGYKEFIAAYNKNKTINDTLISGERYTNDQIRLFVPPNSPVPVGVLRDLLNSAGDYNTLSGNMFENLNIVLSDGSKYPEKDRLAVIELYKQYLKSYTNICYLKMQLAILPLNDYGRKPVLETLPYIAVFGDKFASQPFINNKSELESSLSAENVKLRDISSKLNSYGMKGL